MIASRAFGIAAVLALALVSAPPAAAKQKRERLDLQRVRLTLPGAPAAVLPGDVNRDGRPDLVVVLAYTEIESIGVDRIEEMVQISTVVPALFDRRELRLFFGTEDGSYVPGGAPLELPPDLLAIARGPESHPLLALTDAGVSAIEFDDTGALSLLPLIDERPVLAGARTFFSLLQFTADVDGDSDLDLVVPALDGLAIYLSSPEGIARKPIQRVRLPGDRQGTGSTAYRDYPLPRIEDFNGDGRPDLQVGLRRNGLFETHLLLGRGDGTFEGVHAETADCPRARTLVPVALADDAEGSGFPDLSYFGDLDGDARAEAVTMTEIEPEKDSLRANLKQAKKPRQSVEVHRLDDRLRLQTSPASRFEMVGHADFSLDDEPAQLFRDLDGDGRKDLIAITLDFSIFQALKVLTTKRISIGMDFHVWAQEDDLRFRKVEGLDLSEKLKLNLNDLQIGRMAQFAGDFDGDGRIDFVHLGRGTQVTIHRGQPGCRYPAKPDLVIELDEEPQDLMLVKIEDYDDDGYSDLAITRMLPVERQDVTPPVVLDLYLSGGGR